MEPESAEDAGTNLAKPNLSDKYSPPSWSSPPMYSTSTKATNFHFSFHSRPSIFSLEIIKDGTSLQTVELEEKEFFAFGRSPDSDFVLEHPSLSRFHCIVQFNGETNEAFLYDLGSTHGTYLNKQKLHVNEFTPLKDGDQFKLGFSTRNYVFTSRSNSIEAPKKSKKPSVKKRSFAVTWGLQEDAIQEPEQDEVNWKEYSEHNKLTEKQQKLSEKIKKLEKKKERVEMECKRIHEKEAKFDELTGAQITTLLNHERTIESIEQEIEEVEESLQISIHEKLYPNQSRWLAHSKEKHESESDDDMFFDRTKKAKKEHHTTQGKPLSAQNLIKEKRELENQLKKLNEEIDEVKPETKESQGGDSLDAYMKEMASEKAKLESQDREHAKTNIEKRLVEIDQLLKIADPDNLLTK
eukprot:g3843.t1